MNVDHSALETAVTNATADKGQDAAAPASAQVDGTNLDGISEFTFQEQKYTPEKLSEILREYQKLNEQSKSFADQERFEKNLEADLDAVLEDPRLAAKFKSVYPAKYHGIVDRLLRDQRQEPTAQPQTAQSSLPKEFLSEFEQLKGKLAFFEDRAYQTEVKAANAQIDKIVTPLFQKFPMAVEDVVFLKAEQAIAKDGPLSDKAWERIVRESHEANKKKSDQFNERQLKAQLEKGQRGQDTGPGGAAPGQAPVKPRNFGEAQEALLKHLRAGGGR